MGASRPRDVGETNERRPERAGIVRRRRGRSDGASTCGGPPRASYIAIAWGQPTCADRSSTRIRRCRRTRQRGETAMRRRNRGSAFVAERKRTMRSGFAPWLIWVAAKVSICARSWKTVATAIMIAAPFVGGCTLEAGNDFIKSSPIDDVIYQWGYSGEVALGTELRRRIVEIATISGAGGLREAFRNANAKCRSIGVRVECELDRFRITRGLGLAYFTRGRASWHIRISYSEGDKLIDGLVVVVTESSAIL